MTRTYVGGRACCQKIHDWLIRNAKSNDRYADSVGDRFGELAEESMANAKNYRATAADIAALLKEEKP